MCFCAGEAGHESMHEGGMDRDNIPAPLDPLCSTSSPDSGTQRCPTKEGGRGRLLRASWCFVAHARGRRRGGARGPDHGEPPHVWSDQVQAVGRAVVKVKSSSCLFCVFCNWLKSYSYFPQRLLAQNPVPGKELCGSSLHVYAFHPREVSTPRKN